MPISTSSFQGARAKLTIGSLDDATLDVSAQYNPSQIERQRTVGWKPHNAHNIPLHRRKTPPGDFIESDVEYTGGEGRSLTIELLFDGVETNLSVEPQLEALDVMATSRNTSKKASDRQRRPHQCVVVWGAGGLKPMACVIESLTVKYTMFDCDGVPLRATATLKVKEGTASATEGGDFDGELFYSDHPQATARATEWAKRQINLARPGEVIVKR